MESYSRVDGVIARNAMDLERGRNGEEEWVEGIGG